MAKNESLGRAKDAKQDEFYTQRTDIENELGHYAEHFRDKVVYCNCDDPVTSEFWQFFVRVFRSWGLKRLMATHYEPDAQNFSYSLEINEDTNGDGRIDMNDEPVITKLPCNGDFRSAACIELLKQADIVVTNPPFSLFREYVGQLMEYDKKFLIIGNKNAITYKEIFPLIKDNKIWIGYTPMGRDMLFRVPDAYAEELVRTKTLGSAYKIVNGVVMGRSQSVWFTNLDITKRHEPMPLRGNYYYGNEDKYLSYDNYPAIEVSKTIDIPCDYDDIMAVPITFLDKYCPEQFEILGITDRQDSYGYRIKKYGPEDSPKYNDLNARGVLKINGQYKPMYARILIRRRR